VKASIEDVFMQIGNPKELGKQIHINKSLDLYSPNPVYRSWEPSSRLPKSPNLKSVSTIHLLQQILPIVAKYYVVTVRQVYYLLVSIQEIFNNLNEYRRVVRILKRARLAGFIPFQKVIDDTREAKKSPSWNSMEEILRAAINQFRSNWWRDQEQYVEVWLEKRALGRIFYPITNSYDVHLCTGGGYQSWSEVFQASTRFRKHRDKKWIVLYYGDLDPSGKDMPRDIKERFHTLGLDINMVEVALTKEDILTYNLPRNPTKKRDSRSSWYNERYGVDYAVELDALPPKILESKIKSSIEAFCDLKLLEMRSREDQEIKNLWKQRISSY
jgi:hypothetical protein